jgi:hypothetical protein
MLTVANKPFLIIVVVLNAVRPVRPIKPTYLELPTLALASEKATECILRDQGKIKSHLHVQVQMRILH